MSKKENLEIERLKRQLEAERIRADKAWDGLRTALYENVELKMKIEGISKILGVNVENAE